MTPGIDPDFNRLASLVWTHPAISRLRETAGQPVFLVGGAIRDGLADFQVDDIDLVIEGDPVPLARTLDPDLKSNDRFGTVNLVVEGHPVDIAMARTETYPRPGALPEVTPGKLQDDLIRRDFTINAMAIGIERDSELIDPFGGLADLRSGVLRVLHEKSFEDDPTRALRAARYAARFEFDLEPRTAELMMNVNLGSVSRDRVESELRLIALEENALEALRLARLWGLIDFEESRLDLAGRAIELIEIGPWAEAAPREALILEAVFGDHDRSASLLDEPESPWEACRRARGRSPVELVLARSAGATWLDDWQQDWRWVELEITGADLLAAGVPEGPRVGVALDAALEAKLNRGVCGSDAEMEVALKAAEAWAE
ncbi:MAG: CCA tRNA nucleotidyltransferase [Solirubrobacterales bacterium]|nr:CCA tRNA nucleotidyltransferase [Solirubrobacterales bacterium]